MLSSDTWQSKRKTRTGDPGVQCVKQHFEDLEVKELPLKGEILINCCS